MSTQTNEVQIGILFEDGTTRKYSLPNVATEDLGSVKAKILELNAGQTANAQMYKPAMLATFVSNTGSPMQKISSGSYITKVEEVIYSG